MKFAQKIDKDDYINEISKITFRLMFDWVNKKGTHLLIAALVLLNLKRV